MNWKTTLVGVAGLCTALGHLLIDLGSGNFNGAAADAAPVIIAIGLFFAADAKGETK